MDDKAFQGRYDWVEQISDERLVLKLKALSVVELEMLTLIAFDQCNQHEAAQKMSMPYRTFKYRLKK